MLLRHCSPLFTPDIRCLTLTGFLGAEIPKRLPYCVKTSMNITRSARSWLINTYPNAASRVAITGLSYTAIFKGCPSKYQVFQISPHTPNTSRCSQQPTNQDSVIPLRASHCVDSHHFTLDRVDLITKVPVSVSPNPHTSGLDWVEGDIAVPSARRSRASSITSTRLRQ